MNRQRTNKRSMLSLICFVIGVAALCWGAGAGHALAQGAVKISAKDSLAQTIQGNLRKVTSAQRKAAAARRAAAPQAKGGKMGLAAMTMPMLTPGATPDYFNVPNWANSPLPTVDPVTGAVSGGIRKFVDSLPGLGAAGTNNLGQYIPVGNPDTVTYPGCDYYEINLVEYSKQMHSDLPATKLRGYVQVNNGTDANGQNTVVPAPVQYLGPLIVAQKNRPVRVKFTNALPTGSAGDLFLPVDTTAMGAGMGPEMMRDAQGNMMMNPDGSMMMEPYTQNRATLHLHGGNTPWISDGTPHQWVTPAGEKTVYPKGVSVTNVPDMPDPGPGSLTFFYTNQQSARLMFYHDHSYGITRLNVYAGEVAGYLIQDPTEQGLVASGVVPAEQIPLIIQDKTFVPDTAMGGQLAKTDPTWDVAKWGDFGSLWFPHVYMPNQNPADMAGINAFGRWDYGPWFWPPLTTAAGLKNGPVTLADGTQAPGTPNVSMVMESFLDTPVINGTAYPYLPVGRKAYRFRILNGCNDRYLNLQLYYAKSNAPTTDSLGRTLQTDSGEVAMVPATPGTWPAGWPTPDGRDGGWPDPAASGPSMIQIGTEGGFLPAPVVLPNTPVGYDLDKRSITVLNVKQHTLFLGPAERADVIIDFSQVPDGSRLILYNDSPAPVPAGDTRLDYYTGNPDQTSTGGAPTTLAGYGPNTRTIMQFQVAGATAAPAFDLAALNTALPAAFAASQPKPVVPQAAYGPAYNTTYKNTYSRIQDTSLTFTADGATTPTTMAMQPKAIQELFELDYGRMNSTLGVELPLTNMMTQTTIPLGYVDPPTEVIKEGETQLWKVTHNGVDTHAIHFHLFDVQLINRVDWAGVVKPPDANELGWKDTVRMNPLEDAIVALRPHKPELPWPIPDSIRPLNPAMPLGATMGFANIDPLTGNPITVTNELYNFGWEYVWHCHLLGHEEMDMMRPVVFQVAPQAPSALAAVLSGLSANLTWTDNSASATGFTIQRATDSGFTAGLTSFTVGGTNARPTPAYTDAGLQPSVTYYYRVQATSPNGISAWSAPISASTLAIPLAPSALTATIAGPHQVDLAWTDNSGNETGFRIERAIGNGAFAAVGSVVANIATFSDPAAPDGNTLSYRVIAFNTAGDSAPSNTATVILPLAAPSNLVAAMSAKPPLTVTLTYTNNSLSATGFTIQRATNEAFTTGLVTYTIKGTATTYLNNSALAVNTTYYYQVQATLGTAVSAWSAPVSVITTPPEAPSSLTGMASPLSANAPTVTLAWADNSANEGGFIIQRATNSRFTQGVATFTVGANAVGYTDTTPQITTTYYYRVQATNGAGVSAWSNTLMLTTPGQLPKDPTSLTVGSATRTSLTIRWTDNATNEQGFYVERSTAGFNGPWTRINTTKANATSYTNTNLTRNTTYWYRVRAYNGSGNSGYTNVGSGVTLP